MNLLGTERVRDLVTLIQRAEADDACRISSWDAPTAQRRSAESGSR